MTDEMIEDYKHSLEYMNTMLSEVLEQCFALAFHFKGGTTLGELDNMSIRDRQWNFDRLNKYYIDEKKALEDAQNK